MVYEAQSVTIQFWGGKVCASECTRSSATSAMKSMMLEHRKKGLDALGGFELYWSKTGGTVMKSLL